MTAAGPYGRADGGVHMPHNAIADPWGATYGAGGATGGPSAGARPVAGPQHAQHTPIIGGGARHGFRGPQIRGSTPGGTSIITPVSTRQQFMAQLAASGEQSVRNRAASHPRPHDRAQSSYARPRCKFAA